jgi:hypothetical protein
MAVDVPQNKKLDKLELYWNETRVATLYEPPFVQMVNVPPSEGVAYLRAVATLKDDPTPPVEDIVMVNTPQFMEEVNVHLIELPTTVIVNGRRTTDLPQSSFQVFDATVEVGPFGGEFEPVELVRPPFEGTAWARGVAEMAAAIGEGRPHRASGEQAAHVVEILEAAAQSMADGGREIAITSTIEPPPLLPWAVSAQAG